MDAPQSGLPSSVDKTLEGCPKFRIVLIGNSGSGKSSLISNVFKNNFTQAINIEHDRPGAADITQAYESDENPRFILHDSEGFESGSSNNWNVVEAFLREMNAKELQDRVHAIWSCVAAPREGARLQQTGDEKLIKLAQDLHIPLVIVFTKFDLLVNEQRIENNGEKVKLSLTQLQEKAEACFEDRIKDFNQRTQASIVKVSTKKEYLHTLHELVDVTLQCLNTSSTTTTTTTTTSTVIPQNPVKEAVALAIAQRISARPKVEASISEGFKKYWRNLAMSSCFQGHKLKDCVWRIHDDILKVWNFNDPDKILQQEEFFTKMLLLIEPLLGETGEAIQQDDWLSKAGNAAATAMTIAAPFAHVLVAAGVGILTLKFLYGTYKKMALTGRYLGVYIIDLICILQRLLEQTQETASPTPLTKELVFGVVERYKETESFRVHKLVQRMSFDHRVEEEIAKLIREYTIPLETGEKYPDVKKRGKCIIM